VSRRDQLLDSNGNNGSFNSLTSDKLIVVLDPYHNKIDQAWFEVNPAGVRGDQFNGDPSWDPIWEAATRVDSLGWTAEMKIPYSQLRFSRDSLQTWGMQMAVHGPLHERIWSFGDERSWGPRLLWHTEGDDRTPAQLELRLTLSHALSTSTRTPTIRITTAYGRMTPARTSKYLLTPESRPRCDDQPGLRPIR
jgi:hypothetical protein